MTDPNPADLFVAAVAPLFDALDELSAPEPEPEPGTDWAADLMAQIANDSTTNR